MNAKKCDRCGKFYDFYNIECSGNKKKFSKRFNSIDVVRRNMEGGTVANYIKFDLCPDCMADFENFMSSKGE